MSDTKTALYRQREKLSVVSCLIPLFSTMLVNPPEALQRVSEESQKLLSALLRLKYAASLFVMGAVSRCTEQMEPHRTSGAGTALLNFQNKTP